MVKKVVTGLTIISAILGITLIVGAAGNSDCFADFSFFETVKTTLLGLALLIPAIIRGAYE